MIPYVYSWSELIDTNQKPCYIIYDLLEKIFYCDDFYYPLITAYLLTNSAVCSKLPILFIYGRKGTGKSTLGYFAAKLHDIKISTAADSFPALRNSINERKFRSRIIATGNPDYPHDVITEEQNTLLIWDDIDSKLLMQNPTIYRALKCGYDRLSSSISIAEIGGKNIDFDVFGGKIFSSVEPLHKMTKFDELQRRMLVIESKSIPDDGNSDIEIIDLELISFFGLKDLYESLWDNPDTKEVFTNSKKTLMKQKLPFSRNQRTITIDLMATMVAIGFYSEVEAVSYFEAYWENEENKKTNNADIKGLLEDYITNKFKIMDEISKDRPNSYMEKAISHNQIKGQIEEWLKDGYLLYQPRNKELATILSDMGLSLIKGKWILPH